MSYIQIEIGGQLRGLKFNNKALREYTIELAKGVKFINLESTGELGNEMLNAAIYGGLVGHCYEKRIDVDFDMSNVIDWIDDLNNSNKTDGITKAWDIFSETNQYLKWMEDFKEKIRLLSSSDDKKKANQPEQTELPQQDMNNTDLKHSPVVD